MERGMKDGERYEGWRERYEGLRKRRKG